MSEFQFYSEMGFSSQNIEEAIFRFPAQRDRQNLLNWLLQQANVGQIPKKLKMNTSDTRALTYYDSKVKYNGMLGYIDGFDITHSVVRFSPWDKNATRKWLHVSDSTLEWIIIHHNSIPMNAAVDTTWRRQVGVVSVPIGSVLMAITQSEMCGGNIDSMDSVWSSWLKFGGSNTIDHDPIWSAIDGFTSRHAHHPSGGTSPRFSPANLKMIPTSRRHYSMDRCQHELRIELMSYFLTLCDFYAIPMQKFTEHMVLCHSQDDFLNMIITLFPANFDPRKGLYCRNNYTFLEMLTIWFDPTVYLTSEVQKYHSECIPLVDFKMRPFDLTDPPETTVKIKVFFNDMTFVAPRQYKDIVRRHFQALFRRMYENGGRPPPVLINDMYWDQTLEKSKKNYQIITPLSDVLVSHLLPFQQKVVNWMQMKETTGAPLSSMGWKRHQLKDGFTFHTDKFGSLSYSRPSDMVRGGVLAQPSGFGKTVEMLALIASSDCVKPTLVIMHPRALKMWVKEAAKHVPSLKVRKYHGSKRNLNKVQETVNIVLTSFRIVKNDMVGVRNNQDLQGIDWGRIIIDGFESVIGEFMYDSPLQSLRANFKWIMDCPYRSGFVSIVALFKFFNMSKLSLQCKEFKTTNGVLIQKLLSEMTYSQSLSDVTTELPKPVEDITLYQENRYTISYRHLINAIKKNMQANVEDFLNMEDFLRIERVAAVHPSLVSLGSFAEKDRENSGHSSYKTSFGDFLESFEDSSRKLALEDIVKACEDGEEKCTICMGSIDRPTMTSCHHVFCYDCIQSCYLHDPQQRKCPLCRKSGVGSSLLELTNGEVVEDLYFRFTERGRNYKIEKNIYDEIILERANVGCNKMDYILQSLIYTSDKTVIYTTLSAAYITRVITNAGGYGNSFPSITNSMNRKQKDKNMAAFQNLNMNLRFIIMEINPADTETILDTADNVVFFEPCTNENDRQIALNRVIRIGGEKPVKVVTLRTKGTIEDPNVSPNDW
jgi:hypothetical protein